MLGSRILAAGLAASLAAGADAAPTLSRAAASAIRLPVAPAPVPAFLAAGPSLTFLDAPLLPEILPARPSPAVSQQTAAILPAVAALPPMTSPQRQTDAAPRSTAKPRDKRETAKPALQSLRAVAKKTAPRHGAARGEQNTLGLFFDLGGAAASAEAVPITARGAAAPRHLRRPSEAANAAAPKQPPAPNILRGWGAGGWSYIGYLSAVIAGLAVYSPIFPGLAIERFGAASYGLAASLAVLAMPPAAALARKAGNSLGMRRALAASLVGAGAAGAGLFAALGADALSWAGLVAGLVVVQGLFASMRTLDKAVPAGLYGRDQNRLQSFNALSFSLSRIPGIAIPFLLGPLLNTLGTYGTLAIFPLALVAAAPLVLSIKTASPGSGPAASEPEGGDTELLRLSGWGFASQQIMTYVLPFILASGYGSYAFPADAVAAKTVSGMLFGSWTIGALLGTLALMKKFKKVVTPVQNMRRAAVIGALGFSGFIPLLWPYAPLAYAGAALAGLGGTYSFLIFLSGAQANAPAKDRAGAIARYMTLSFGAIAFIVWGMGSLLQAFPAGPVPFAFLIAILASFSALNAAIALRLKKKETS